MQITPDTQQWLRDHDFVDQGVDLDQVRLHLEGPPVLWLHWRKLGAMTLGNDIYFASAELLAHPALIAHELVHVGQYARMGRAAFLAKYTADLARAGFRYSESLPLEVPAYARQAAAHAVLDRQ